MAGAYAVDVVIPTYREGEYLKKTLENLVNQSWYKADMVQIIISDYISEDSQTTEQLCKEFDHVVYFQTLGKGIAHGRNMGCKIGIAPVILNFDADAIFSNEEGIKLLADPILKGKAILTKCDYVLDEEPSNFMMHVSNLFTLAERILPIGRTAGLTVSRKAFSDVGGFRNVVAAEDYLLNLELTALYGVLNQKFITDVQVIASARRFRKFDDEGFNVLNYHKQFR